MTMQPRTEDGSYVPPPRASDLPAKVAESVAAGLREIEDLQAVVDGAAEVLQAAAGRLAASDESEGDNGFAELSLGAAEALGSRIQESREVLGTFNIAFFGRTGAGKSTLLSALGGLDGARVLPGDQDWTTDVADIEWQGCRLFDTPGTGGWGRTRSRAELEEKARGAVERADVVILCFDDQSQQQAEFERVAEWVRAYGKPAIAVLNIRNGRWRHPAKVHDEESRKAHSDTVRQHVDNINGELAAIGLPGVPVVAINSKRALVARAAQPYQGPDLEDVKGELAVFGVEYLDDWSNLRVLEDLIAACLVVGGQDLRLASMRDGLRSALREWAEGMRIFSESARVQSEVTERSVGQMLEVLGYPDDETRATHLDAGNDDTDLLTALERLREQPFDAQVVGQLRTHGRHLLRAHLGVERKKSLRRAEDLIMDSFESEKRVKRGKFEKVVFDEDAVAAALAAVAHKIDTFLDAQLQLSGTEGIEDLELLERRGVRIEGSAGAGARTASTVLRAGGVLSGGVPRSL